MRLFHIHNGYSPTNGGGISIVDVKQSHGEQPAPLYHNNTLIPTNFNNSKCHCWTAVTPVLVNTGVTMLSALTPRYAHLLLRPGAPTGIAKLIQTLT